MLKERIARYCNKNGILVRDFHNVMSMSLGTYYKKINSKDWKVSEINLLRSILHLTDEEVLEIIKEGAVKK